MSCHSSGHALGKPFGLLQIVSLHLEGLIHGQNACNRDVLDRFEQDSARQNVQADLPKGVFRRSVPVYGFPSSGKP